MPMNSTEIDAWLEHHATVNPRHDWPEDEAFWLLWRKRITALKCDLETACEASVRVAQQAKPRFVDQHLDAVADAVTAIYRERDARRGSSEGLVERAKRGDELEPSEVSELHKLSAGCRYCGGNGLAIRHGKVDPSKTLTLHCVCVLGRWIRERTRKTAPGVYHKVRDLAEHDWLNHPAYGGPEDHAGGEGGGATFDRDAARRPVASGAPF